LICSVLERNPRATCAELAAALGVCSRGVTDIVRRIRVSASAEALALLDAREKEIRSRWWAKRARDPEKVVAEIRAFAEELGRPPKMCDAGALACRAIRAFGSWNAALRAAGLSLFRVSLPGDPTSRREALVAAVRKAAEAIGRAPTCREYNRVCGGLSLPKAQAIQQFFGSWGKSLEEAGLTNPRDKRRELLQEAERILLSGALFVSASGLPGSHSEKTFVKRVLKEKDVRVLLMRKQSVEKLDAVARLNFPELPGLERAREFTLRAAAGEALVEIAASAGLSSERVRQLLQEYVGCVLGEGLSQRKRSETSREEAVASLRTAANLLAGIPTIKEYEELRRAGNGLVPFHKIWRTFGSWRAALGAAFLGQPPLAELNKDLNFPDIPASIAREVESSNPTFNKTLQNMTNV
jgi:DNA-binding Lrp family transcriptional regulator